MIFIRDNYVRGVRARIKWVRGGYKEIKFGLHVTYVVEYNKCLCKNESKIMNT